jgi:hypothetical protein
MPNEGQNPNVKAYDLEERTAKFGESIIEFAKSLPHDRINDELVGQLVKAGTSVGANYYFLFDSGDVEAIECALGICHLALI